jgi:hypothetical protein
MQLRIIRQRQVAVAVEESVQFGYQRCKGGWIVGFFILAKFLFYCRYFSLLNSIGDRLTQLTMEMLRVMFQTCCFP